MGEKQLNNVLDAKTGVKDTLPTVLGYVGIGTAFGIIAHTNGFSPLETFVMSLLVYTASGEFALVSMLPAGAAPAVGWRAPHARLRRRQRVTGWHRIDDDHRQGRSPHGK